MPRKKLSLRISKPQAYNKYHINTVSSILTYPRKFLKRFYILRSRGIYHYKTYISNSSVKNKKWSYSINPSFSYFS